MTTAATAGVERAERVAAFLRPRSVAVVGATPSPARIGGRVVEYLTTHHFDGRVYPVNPRHEVVQGHRTLSSLADAPERVDLAVIAVPSERVVEVVESAGGRASAYLVLSGGFAETGPAGREVEQRLLAAVRRQDAVLLGPNAAGFVNLRERVAATFVPTYLHATTAEDLDGPGGRVALVTQSGAFGAYLAGVARQRGVLPLNWVATGNEADLSAADFLTHYARQPDIDVIVAYLEGIADSDGLAAALALIDDAGKLLVLSRTGTSAPGARAARSHTGALIGPGEGLDALLRGHRVVQTRSVDDIIDLMLCGTTGCVPAGRRLAIISGSGGAAVVMADEADHRGLALPPISAEVASIALGNVAFAAAANPLDTTGQLMNNPRMLADALEPLIEQGDFDAVAAYVGGGTGDPHMVDVLIETIGAVRERHAMPIVLVGSSTPDVLHRLHDRGLPVLYDPVRAVRILAALAHMSAEVEDCRGGEPLATSVPEADPQSWDEPGLKAQLRTLGVAVPDGVPVDDRDAAVAAAGLLGFPVVVKGVADGLVHKSDLGAVRLGLRTGEDVGAAADSVLAVLAEHGYPDPRLLVETNVSGAVELLVSVRRDPVHGILLVLASGGVWAELVKDMVAEVLPTSTARLRHVLSGLRCWPQLQGFRGGASIDPAVLIAELARIAEAGHALVRAGELTEIEFNPVLVADGRLRVADAVAYRSGAGRES